MNKIYDDLYNNYLSNKFSHAFLFETDDVDQCLNDLKILIKKLCCNNTYNENCNKCNLCHLIDEGSLPSVKFIYGDGNSIKTDDIIDLQKCFTLTSFYTKINFYVIVGAEKMNQSAYNKLLKFLEEPENNIIGFLITNNSSKVASTIVSRCTNLKVYYNSLNEGYFFDEANKLISYDNWLEYFNFISADDLNKEFLLGILKCVFSIYTKNNDIKKAQIVYKYLEQLNYNVNIGLVIRSISIEMGRC